MARIAGIQIEKDSKGRLTYARFNLKNIPKPLNFCIKLELQMKMILIKNLKKVVKMDLLLKNLEQNFMQC
ncbi:MAG: hypothetical protein A2046_05745 [Bacteroidetes bacterium GWA2_30_7]|nr:MAG: hypothetical protein A2046_05745 [Bacteroidetes bacterium GWA2_30_7]